jgi:hypothetical protein
VADFTLGPARFPVGTVVSVFVREAFVGDAGPFDDAVTTATTDAQLVTEFSGLAFDTVYWAAAELEGSWRRVAFRTEPQVLVAATTADIAAEALARADAITAAVAPLATQTAVAAVDAEVVALDGEARKWFPVPTGADDAAELISRLAAGERHVPLRPFTTYNWNQALGTIPADAAIVGAGKRSTVVNKGFNGTLATLADGVQLRDMKIDGKGATRTGKGFVFAGTDGRQSLSQVEMVDLDDYCLDFATGAGSQSEFIGCKFARYNGIARDVYSVRIDAAQQLAAVPRKFIACETDGTPFLDLGGCNDLFIGPGGYLGKLKFSAESRGVVALARFGGDYSSESPAGTATTVNGSATITAVAPTTGWANGMHIAGAGIPADTIILSGAGTSTMVLSNPCTASASGVAISSSVLFVRGFNHYLSGDFAPQPVIAAGNYSSITIHGTHNNAPVLDLSNFSYRNLIDSPLVPYTPVLSSDGTAPTLGSGTVSGRWARSGSTIYFEIVLTRAADTSFGTGTLRLSLPATPTSGLDQSVPGMALDVSVAGNMHYLLAGVISSGVGYVTLRADGLAFGVGELNAPGGMAWATGDIIRVSGTYDL